MNLLLMTFLMFSLVATSVQPLSSEPIQEKKIESDFTSVAKVAIPAVVSIKVKMSPKKSEYSLRRGFSDENSSQDDPFGFFNDDFFNRFFNAPRQKEQSLTPQIGQGSGFIISQDGYIITNNHVVKDADTISVLLKDGREFTAKVIGQDSNTDVALIKIEAKDLPFLKLGNSDALEIGQWVVAIGNPLGLQASLTVGVVSAKGRSDLDLVTLEDFIQTDAAINRGNSGGPLLNLSGEVVGVNTAIASSSGGYMGIGFAIPSSMVHYVIEQLMTTGKVSRGYLGVVLQKVDNNLADAFGLSKIEGGLVADVTKDSPAEKAGLKQGDVILKYNDHNLENISAFRNAIALYQPGKEMALKVKRDGKIFDLKVIIAPFPDAETLANKSQKLGLEVEDLTPEIAQNLGYTSEKGVVVTGVQPNSQAGLLGVKRGQLIVGVNHKKVTSTNQFTEALKDVKEGDTVLLLIKSGQIMRYIALKAE